MFATLGMATYGVRAIAAAKGRAERSRTFWSAFCAQAIVSGIVLISYIFYCLTNPQGGPLIASIWGLWVLSCAFDVSWLLFGVEEFTVTATRSCIVKLVSTSVIFIVVKDSSDLWGYVLSISAAFLIEQLSIWPFVSKFVDWIRPTWSEIRFHFIPNLRLFVPVVAISLYTSLDKILLGSFSTLEQTGFFDYSQKLSTFPQAIITALGTVLLPRMSALFTNGEKEKAVDLLEDSVWIMEALAVAFFFGIAAIAPEFPTVFLGDEFEQCSEIMPIIALTLPLVSATNVLGKQYLLPTYRDSFYTLSVFSGALVNLLLCILLLPSLAALGAAIATVGAEAAVLVAQCLITRRELPLRSLFANCVPFVVIGATMYALVRVAARCSTKAFGVSVATLAIEVIVGMVTYAALFCVYCLLTKNKHYLRLFMRGKK